MADSALVKKAVFLYSSAILSISLLFFISAGTLNYPQAWAYMAVLFIPVLFVGTYFLKNNPEFLERRFKMKEKEARQALIQKASALVFIIGFLLPGLDRRFGWSSVPFEISLLADAIVLLGYLVCFLVFKENSYAGRTIRVEKGQTVISTGFYSIIRHPMYFGVALLYLPTPIALGSLIAFPAFLLVIPILVFRILNEEEVLRRDLPGYSEYCEKTRYRLVPHIW